MKRKGLIEEIRQLRKEIERIREIASAMGESIGRTGVRVALEHSEGGLRTVVTAPLGLERECAKVAARELAKAFDELRIPTVGDYNAEPHAASGGEA